MIDEKLDRDLKKMQDAIHQGALFIVENSKDITALQEWQIRQNGTLLEMRECLKEIKDDINALEVEVVRAKPSWATLVIITFLSSVAVGAIVYTVKVASML